MIITIARQCGCNGDELGKALAQKYNLKLFDKKAISKMAKEGDLLACETFNIEGRYLGQVIASSCMLLNPEKVIIGGGVAMSFNLFKQSLLETVAQEAHIFAMGTPAKIQVTALGYDAGLLVAAAVALQAEGDT